MFLQSSTFLFFLTLLLINGGENIIKTTQIDTVDFTSLNNVEYTPLGFSSLTTAKVEPYVHMLLGCTIWWDIS